MQPETARRLIELNRRFYSEHGEDFSETRLRLQPGVRLVLESLRQGESILDLGCGNGELARALSKRGHAGSYLGLDFSPTLLKEAEAGSFTFPVKFDQADLTGPGWGEAAGGQAAFDMIFAFAVLHHIPGREHRLGIVKEAHGLLKPGGVLIHSNWLFMDSPRWRGRVQPWEQAGLRTEDVDPGDYLLDWRHGTRGLRYVHLFNEAELRGLAEESGFEMVETFHSDGENGKMSLYQKWKRI